MNNTENPFSRSQSFPGDPHKKTENNGFGSQSFSLAPPKRTLFQRIIGVSRSTKKTPGSSSPSTDKPNPAAEEKRKSLEDDVYLGDTYTHAFSPGRSPWNESLEKTSSPSRDLKRTRTGRQIESFSTPIAEQLNDDVKHFLHSQDGLLGAAHGAGIPFRSLGEIYYPRSNGSEGEVWADLEEKDGQTLRITSRIQFFSIMFSINLPDEFSRYQHSFVDYMINDQFCLFEKFMSEPFAANISYLYRENSTKNLSYNYEWERRLSDAVFGQSPFLAYHRVVLRLSSERLGEVAKGDIILHESDVDQQAYLIAYWIEDSPGKDMFSHHNKVLLADQPQLKDLIKKLKKNLCVSTDREDIAFVADLFQCRKNYSIETVPFLHLPSLRDAYQAMINAKDMDISHLLTQDLLGAEGRYQGIRHEDYIGHVAFESSRITMTLLMTAFCPALVQTILADFDLKRQHLEIMSHCLQHAEYLLWTHQENLLGLIETLERHIALEQAEGLEFNFQALRSQIENDWNHPSKHAELLLDFIKQCAFIVEWLRQNVEKRVRQFKAFCKKAHDEFPMLLWQRVKSLLEDINLAPSLSVLAQFENKNDIFVFANLLSNAINEKEENQKEKLEIAKEQMHGLNCSACSQPLKQLVDSLKSLIDLPPYRGNFLEPISDAEWRASKSFHPYLRYVIEKTLIPYQALVDYMPVIHDLNMRHFFKKISPCWHEQDKQKISGFLNQKQNVILSNNEFFDALDGLDVKEKERVYWALYELRSTYFSGILQQCAEVLFEGIFKDKTPFSETRDCDGKIRDSDDTFGLKLFAMIDECYQCSLYLNNAKKNFTKVMASYLDEIEKNISGGQTSNLYKQVQCLKTFYENHLFDYSGEFSEEQINADGFLSNLIDEANTIHKAAKQSIPSSENVEPYAPLDFFVNTGLAYLKQNATADALFFFRRTLWISAAHYLFQRLQPQISSFSGQMSTAVDRLKILMLNMKSFLFLPYEAELKKVTEQAMPFEDREIFNRWLSLKAGKFDKYEDGRLLTVTLVCRAVFSGIKGWDDLMGLPWNAPSAWNNCISILTEGLDRVLTLKNNEDCHVFLPYLFEKIIACVFKIYHISCREPLILGSEKNWGSFIAKLKELAQCQPVFVPFVNVCSLLSENLFQTKHNFLFCLLSFYKVLHELRQENPCLVEEDTLKKIEAIWSSSVSRRYFLSKDVAAKLSVFFEDLSDAACENMKGFFKELVQNLVCLGNVLLVFLSTNAKLDVSRQLLCKKLENNQASLPVLLIAWSSKAYHAVEIHRLNKRIFSYECFLDASNLFAQAYQAHILSSCQEKTWQDCCSAMGLDNVALSQHFNIDFFNLTLQLWYQGLMQWRQQSHQQPKVWPKEFLSTVVCGGQQDSFANPIVFRDKAVRAIVAVFQLSYLIRLVLLELCKQDPLNQKVVLHWLYAINWMICDVKHPLESLEKEGVQHTDLIQLVPQELNPPFRAKVQGIFNEWQKVEEDPKSLAESHPRQLAYLGWFKERGNKESFTNVTTVSLGK